MQMSSANHVLDREQACSMLRKLIVETDSFFKQQEKMLLISYADLNEKISRLRTRVRQAEGHSGSPIHGLSTPYGYSGSGGNGMSSTPMRSVSAAQNVASISQSANMNGVTARSLLSGGPPGTSSFSDMVMGSHGGVGLARPLVSTPPNKQLDLSQPTSKSPSQPQNNYYADERMGGEWGSLSGNHTRNGDSSNIDSMMASPQAVRKSFTEDLVDRFMTVDPTFNFDTMYEQLTSGGRENSASQERGDASGFGAMVANRSVDMSGNSPTQQRGGNRTDSQSNDADAIPVERLMAIKEMHVTSGLKAVYEHGRPCAVPIEGGAVDDPAAFGIDVNAGCEVLVEFKRKRVLQYQSPRYAAPGTYVVVGGDRGEDLGLVVYTWCESRSPKAGSSAGASAGSEDADGAATKKGGVVAVGLRGVILPRTFGVGTGMVLRHASEDDVQMLQGVQSELERRAIGVCAQRVLDFGLPMVIVDAEYQFDKKKLTFYYEAQQRMDFRDLVRDLYKTFRARIWMEVANS